MKKVLMGALLFCVLFCGVAHADVLDILRISDAQGVSDLSADGSLSVTGTNVVYSGAFSVTNQAHAFSYQASGTTVELKLELEQGMDLPTDAGEADDAWAIPEGAEDLDLVLDDSDIHIKAYPPAAAQYARFKITGTGSNGADTTITTLKVGRQR